MPFSAAKNLSFLSRHLIRRNPFALARAQALIARERLPAAALLARQETLLHATIAAARARLPAYAALPALAPDGDARQWLRQHCQVISKTDLLAGRQRYYPRLGARRPWWPQGKTSGTSGTPLEVFRSLSSIIWEEAFHLQYWHWAGYRPGQPQAVLRGDQVTEITRRTPPFWLWDRFGKQLFLSTRHLARETAPAILARLASSGAGMLRAYPSAAYVLAHQAQALGQAPRLAAVVCGSEPVFPFQREQIEASFGCRVFDFYGMAERIAFAGQCEHGFYHLHPEYAWVEILDEHDQPTTDFGFVVGTTLHNHVMPLLRYRINDRARWLPGECPCGRHYPRIELASGKVEDQLYDRDGNPVSASIITFALKSAAHIRQTQVAQTGPGQWRIRVVPDAGYTEAHTQGLRDNFQQYVSPRVEVTVELVDHIALQASGKFKWVSQEWPGAAALAGAPAARP